LRRSARRGGLTYDWRGWTLDPLVAMARLRVLLWRYGGGGHEDAAFAAAYPFFIKDVDEFEENLIGRCAYLSRYLRQPMSWIESLDNTEAQKWEAAVEKLVKSELGIREATAPLPGIPTSPFGFGDFEGGG
jgi:hypothetical protein